jgi:hypothetical protein
MAPREDKRLDGVLFRRTDNEVLAGWFDGYSDFDFVTTTWLAYAARVLFGGYWSCSGVNHAGNGNYSALITLDSEQR